MDFVKMRKQLATHKILHIRGVVKTEENHILSCQYYYPSKDQPKHVAFNRFWRILWQINLYFRGYFGQTIYTFNKLAELTFEKEKPHNPSLIAKMRVLLLILEYDDESEVDIVIRIFQIEILLKKSKFFTTSHTDHELIKEMQTATRKRDVKQHSSSLVKTFSNIFKRRSSATLEISHMSLPLELDANMKKSKSQYQTLRTRKFSFEVSDLSKHPIKNLQSTINILSDKKA